ncbi:MAG: DUF3450 family protein [Fibrobacter sp.]|jgi:biopolymer transport protein ExbB|nr:DUF3450 family protein [Fibrobacter sp.]
MKILSALFFLLIACSGVFAQQNSGDALVKARAELNSAKADLEDARKKRDMAVAARWKDRETANQERELFNERYSENKEKLDALMAERSRLQEEVRMGREDLSQLREAADRSRAEFLALSSQQERLNFLTQAQDQGIPFRIPERLERVNQVKKDIERYGDDPLKVAQEIFTLTQEEIRFTRAVEFETGELLFDHSLLYGKRLRLGGIFAVQEADNAGPVALMLPTAGEKGRKFVWQVNAAPEIREAVETAFRSYADSAWVMVPVDALLSTALSSEMAQTTVSWKQNLRDFFRNGGLLMYPIAFLFVVGLLIVAERYARLSAKNRTGRYREVLMLCEAGDIAAAKERAKNLRGSVGLLIQKTLSKDYPNRAAAEKAMEEVFASEVPAIERGLSTISVFATTAPLLGLLGTVMGMVELFEVITMHGTSDPKLLASGISIALITTEAGLMVAIPLQFLHTFLTNKADRLVAKMEKTGLALLNALWIKDSND